MIVLEPGPKSLEQAIKALKKGKIIVCPTDTVYGLVCRATSKKAVDRLFKIKKREKGKPLPIFVKDIQSAKKLAQIGPEEENFLKKAWPGKVTVVLKRKGKRKIYGVARETIALRIPDYKLVLFLLEKTGFPLTGTSANISKEPASTRAKEIISCFQEQKLQPDLIIDQGSLKPARPSKVIDLTGPKPKVLRR